MDSMELVKAAALVLAVALGIGLTLLGAAFDWRARRRARLARRRYLPTRAITQGTRQDDRRG